MNTISIESIGSGIDGDIYKVTEKNKKPFVIKAGDKMQIQQEEIIHNMIYNKVSCKRSFVKPLQLSSKLRLYLHRTLDLDDTEHLYAMEYVDGFTLRMFLKNITSRPLYNKVLSQVKNSMKCLWKAGFIHGDAHMKNILVMFSKGTPKIKIFDFGFSMKFNSPKIKDEKHLLIWFESKWKNILQSKMINKGNPDTVYFNLNFLPFFAEHNKHLLKNKQKENSSIKL